MSLRRFFHITVELFIFIYLLYFNSGREGLQGLAERVVATESLVFLAQQFELLHNHLEALIPTAKKAFLQQFFSQVSVA